MATTPGTHPDLYVSVLLGGVFSPGKVTLSGHDRPERWETQAAKGQTGYTSVHHGDDVREFVATFFLADLEDVAGWDDFQKILESTVSGPKPKALPCYHPDLVRNRIGDVVVKKIGGFVHDALGGATVAVTFLEYRPPKPKAAAKANASPKPVAKTDPNAVAKAELQGLLDQVQNP